MRAVMKFSYFERFLNCLNYDLYDLCDCMISLRVVQGYPPVEPVEELLNCLNYDLYDLC